VPSYSIEELNNKVNKMRRHILTMATEGKTSHIGSALSCVEILAVLYFHIMSTDPLNWDSPQADRFILSKGHGAMAWYAALAEAGFLEVDQLKQYAADGGHLGEHPSHHLGKGIKVSTGSLGHGLSIGLGMALAKKMDQHKGNVFVLLSDGECNEGSIWEAAMWAAAQQLDNLIVMVDDNHIQAMGHSRRINALEPFAGKWEAFGWQVAACDGHNPQELTTVLQGLMAVQGKPKVLIARTFLGKGISFMEDKLLWHYQVPSADDLSRALAELGQA